MWRVCPKCTGAVIDDPREEDSTCLQCGYSLTVPRRPPTVRERYEVTSKRPVMFRGIRL